MFLIDGRPDGLRTVELSNSTVLGTVIPRAALPRFLEREAAQRPGLYFLLGAESGNARDRVYIGEGDPVGPRLKSHGAQKEFWSQAAVFTSKDAYLTKTQVQFLESALIGDAKAIGRATLDNTVVPSLPNISEADQAEVEGFLDQIKLLLGAAGFDLLRPWAERVLAPKASEIFTYAPKPAKASMIRSETAYVVLAGSTAHAECKPSAQDWIHKLRNQLAAAGVLVPGSTPDVLNFAKDASFPSASAAAVAVYGGHRNGPEAWKLADGRTLKEVESSE
jgi:hypothetical protein